MGSSGEAKLSTREHVKNAHFLGEGGMLCFCSNGGDEVHGVALECLWGVGNSCLEA